MNCTRSARSNLLSLPSRHYRRTGFRTFRDGSARRFGWLPTCPDEGRPSRRGFGRGRAVHPAVRRWDGSPARAPCRMGQFRGDRRHCRAESRAGHIFDRKLPQSASCDFCRSHNFNGHSGVNNYWQVGMPESARADGRGLSVSLCYLEDGRLSIV